MTNPFDDAAGTFSILINAEGQHSLWPAFAEIPDGWQRAFGPADRDSCLDFVRNNWTDMRPRSLIAAMSVDADRT